MDQSLKLAQTMGDRPAEMRSLNNLAMIYRVQGNLAKAAEFYAASLTLAEELQELNTQEQVLRNLGNAYHALGDYHKTIEYYDRLLTLTRELNQQRSGHSASTLADIRGLMRILRNLTSACTTLGDYTNAIKYLEQRLDLVRRLDDTRGEEQILEHLGNNHEALGNVDQALAYYEQRLQVLIQMQDTHSQRHAFNQLRCACLSHGDFTRIRPYIRLFSDSAV
jgi:tetratricopeptide (TPR) repeat protein